MKKRIVIFLLVLALALSLAPAALAAAPDEDILPPPPADGPVAGVTLNTEQHINYISGMGGGIFAPNDYVTRGEAAQMLYKLLADKVPVTVSYTDVAEGSWYHDAALQLGSLGVIRPDEETFRADDVISRGEFVRYVSAFFPLRADAAQFPDVDPDDENAAAILSARAYGWLLGYPDGTVGPNGLLRRSETVAILNRALGRTGDASTISAERPALYLDVAPSEWYYQNVMEATVPHEHTSGENGEVWTSWTEADTNLPDGFRTEGAHLIDGWSYYYDASAKDILRGQSKNGFTAGADGRFTTGDSWIDEQLRIIILAETDASMSREEMLKALYAHCRDKYSYLSWNRNAYDPGNAHFALDAARQMLTYGRGNCYCFAATFCYLSRWIGYDTKMYSGKVLGGPHGWTEINGYIYDTQLEWRYYHDYHSKYGEQYLWYFYGLKDTTNRWKYVMQYQVI